MAFGKEGMYKYIQLGFASGFFSMQPIPLFASIYIVWFVRNCQYTARQLYIYIYIQYMYANWSILELHLHLLHSRHNYLVNTLSQDHDPYPADVHNNMHVSHKTTWSSTYFICINWTEWLYFTCNLVIFCCTIIVLPIECISSICVHIHRHDSISYEWICVCCRETGRALYVLQLKYSKHAFVGSAV